MSDWPTIQDRLERAREQRRRPAPPPRLGDFLPRLFEREVRRPFEQIGALGEIWAALVPASLLPRTALKSFRRGTLIVGVDSNATMYQLNRALAGGLEHELRCAYRGGTFRRVKLQIDPALGAADTA